MTENPESREYPSRPYCAVGAIVRKGEQLLLIRRGQPPRSGEWSVPGGGIELGETMGEAARREIREECGIEIAVGDMVDAIDIIQRDPAGRIQFHYVIVDLAATYVRGELQAGSDITDARWIAPGDLDRYPMNGRTRAVLLKALGRGSGQA